MAVSSMSTQDVVLVASALAIILSIVNIVHVAYKIRDRHNGR